MNDASSLSPSSLKSAKALLRQEALKRRALLTPMAAIEGGLVLAERALTALDDAVPLDGAMVISGFTPIQNEIDPRPLMDALRQRGHSLCLPVVVKPSLIFRELKPGAEMVEAGFGTYAPSPEARVVEPDVLLTPLAAFDRQGGRIGYGRGYYDHAISDLRAKGRKPFCVGVAYSQQEVETVPCELHDQPLDMVITERDVIFCNKVV